MKCPKCHYLSFEPEPRCRNCGYDLELADADLSMREFESEEDLASAADLPLREETLTEEPATIESRSLLRDRLRQSSEPSRATVLDLPSRPRPVRRPRAVPTQTQTRTARTAAAAARVAALDAPVSPSLSDAMAALEPFESAATLIGSAETAAETQRDETAHTEAPVIVVAPMAEPFPSEARRAASRVPTSELPLFIKGLAEGTQSSEEELLGRAASPRAPLGVRRRAPEPVGPAIEAAGNPVASAPDLSLEVSAPSVSSVPSVPMRPFGAFDRDLIDDLARIERDDVHQRRAEARALVRAAEIRAHGDAASAVLRLAAAIVDLTLMAALGLAIVALTLRICGLSFSETSVLPVIPLVGFLLLVGAGYLLLFTVASGQTIGKMTFGLRTVGEEGVPDHREPLTTNQAAKRALLTIPSVLALGLGFLPALFGERRALHDRLAHTRVVRA